MSALPSAEPRGAPGRRDAWQWAALAAQILLPPLTVASLLSAWQLGAQPWQLAFAVAAGIALHVGLALARRAPWLGYATTSFAMLIFALTPFPGWSPSIVPSALCFLLVLWWIAATRPTREAVAALAIAVLGILFTECIDRLRDSTDSAWERTAATVMLLVITAGGWGLAVLARRRAATLLQAERDRLGAAIADERAGIRRDLHDVIAHTVTALVARTEAAAVTTSDAATRSELVAIAESGRDAHAGLRAMLAAADSPGPDGRRAPISLDSLPDLIAAATSPLHTVTLRETGVRRPLTLSAEIAVVRTVQEGVSNALRHLRAPVTVAVELAWSEVSLSVSVRDDGGAGVRGGSAGGTGLLGLAERIRAAGGTHAVTQTETGWIVTAELPTKSAGDS